MARAIRVAVAQAPSLEREALRRLLDREDGCDLVGVVGPVSEIGRLGSERPPDVVLLDARLPGDTTLGALDALARLDPAPRVLVLGDAGEGSSDFVLLGAQGVIRPEAEPAELLRAISAVTAGEVWVGHGTVAGLVEGLLRSGRAGRSGRRTVPLSPKEAAVARAVAEGSSNQEIADGLSLTVASVKSTLRRVFVKLGVSNRAELTVLVTRDERLGNPEPLDGPRRA
jgi:DNA-binding NarL/FixJ family response regulator